jgi:2-dehydro-3-deoxygluconokinase
MIALGEAMIEFSGDDERGWHRGLAGDTFNTLWYARALLDPTEWNVAYFTRVGIDRYSDELVRFLEASGCGTGYVQRDPARQLGLYLIALADGERSFTYWRETSAARRLADDAVLLRAALEAADVIYFSGITLAILPSEGRELLIRLVAEATERGALTAFDPNIRTALWPDSVAMREAMTRAASASTVVLPSFSDEAAAFGDGTPAATAARYSAAGPREVVVKDGAADTIVFAGGRTVGVTPQPVAVVDTTGAGDSFNGAYLAARLNGLAPEAAAREGQRVAGIVVGRQGAIVPAADVAMPAEAG